MTHQASQGAGSDLAAYQNLKSVSDHRPFNAYNITLFVLGTFSILLALSIGGAGFARLLPLGRVAPYLFITGGILLGIALIISSIYKNALYNVIHELPRASKHNHLQKAEVERMRKSINLSNAGLGSSCSDRITRNGWEERRIAMYEITERTANRTCDRIIQQIDACTRKSQNVWLNAIDDGKGKITVFLLTLEKV